MTGILTRYLTVTVVKYYLLFSAIALAVATLVQFAENRDGLLNDSHLTVADVVKFSLFNAPEMFTVLAGFISVISVIISWVVLARFSEATAMLAAGLSYRQVLLALMPAAAIIAGLHFCVENIVVPNAAIALSDIDIGDAADPAQLTDAAWIRVGDGILSVGKVRQSDRTLEDVQFFDLGRTGHLIEHIAAPLARFEGGRIVFTEATRTISGKSKTAVEYNALSGVPIDFETVFALTVHPRDASARQIGRVLDQIDRGAQPRQAYALWFQKKFAAPLTTALVVLLLGALIQRTGPAKRSTWLLFFSVSAGFVFFVLDGILIGMGEAGAIPAFVAAWAAPSMLATIVLGSS